MTRDQAIELRMEIWSGSDSWKRGMAAKDVDNFVALGMLKLDDEPLSLWSLLRKHGVAVHCAQSICNEAMIDGVRLPESPQVTEDTRP